MTFINILDVLYPIGSVYFSTNSTSPSSIIGGTWVQLKNTFLYANTSSGLTGGSSTHTHGYGVQYASFYYSVVSLYNAVEQLICLKNNGTWNNTVNSAGTVTGANVNNGLVDSYKQYDSIVRKEILANTDSTSTLPPYTTVYCWHRTA